MADAADGTKSNWHRQRAEQRAAEAASRPAGGRSTPKATRKSADRWATLNEFVDVIAPAITKTEAVVWLLLFRHAKGGVVETSERAVATALQLKKFSAGRAIRGLVAKGLVWPIHRSATKAVGSKYGLHPHPSKCLGGILGAINGDGRNRAHDVPG